MRALLTNLKSKLIKCVMKVIVLIEIHTMVSKMTVFDEIRENLYLHKSPSIHWFESKNSFNPFNLIQYHFVKPNPSF